MLYSQITDGMMEARIGPMGLQQTDYDTLLKQSCGALDKLRDWHADGSLPLLRLPEETADLAALQPIVERIRKSFKHVVLFGTGGSSLGGQTLCALAASPTGQTSPAIHFVDNIDPITISSLLDELDFSETFFIVISKSGGTGETMSQFLIFWQAVCSSLGEEHAARHFLLIAENADNPLRRLANKWELQALDHDPKVGGRFSVLSIVGMLPAMIAGLDCQAIRRGAGTVLHKSLSATEANQSLPAVGATLAIGLETQRSIRTSVIMPYADHLSHFGMWYRQLWAESLGKAGNGTTPVRALGTVDQHSQLQLYLDGPNDKMFTVIMATQAGKGPSIPADMSADPSLDYLNGRRIGDVFDSMQRATAETLMRKGRPVRVFKLDSLREESMGALLMHFMLETIIAAHLLNVDAFDQPAVEDGKILAREYLSSMSK